MTQPSPVDLNASEALYAFAGWLTTRDEVTEMGAMHDCAPIAKLVGDFCAVNGLPDVRESFANASVRHPVYPEGGQ